MKLILTGLILIAGSAHANCDLYLSDALALSDESKKDEKIIDEELFLMLKNKSYNPIVRSTAKWPIKDGFVLTYQSTIVEKAAFLKRGLAALHFKLIDQKSKKTTYTHLHGVSCKFRMKKHVMKFEKDCMENIKIEMDFLPDCQE